MLLAAGAAVATLAVGVAGWLLMGWGSPAAARSPADIHEVRRGPFEIVVPSSGELQALSQIEIVNKLESKAVITELVAEGTTVERGQTLFRIADEEIRNRIKDAEDAVKSAEAALVAAQTALSVRRSAAASEEDKAELTVELAGLALRGWAEGDEKVQRETLEVAKRTAEINYTRLQRKYEESQRLHRDGHISFDEMEQDRIALIESENRVTTATLELDVYVKYTFDQEKKKRQSDLEQAESELGRVRQRNEAEIGNAVAAVVSAEHKFNSAKDRLAQLVQQLEYCHVVAPSAGLVVYATSLEGSRFGGGMSDRALQVGSELYPNQLVIILPDTSQMVAAVKVNEALSGRIRPGQRAVVASDAMPNVSIPGEVLGIGVLAESSGWRDPNRRDYTVRIVLRAQDLGLDLKPSMRCKADIVVDSVESAVHVPIQSVFRRGGSAFVFALDGDRYERREVRTGRASETEVEILAGLAEGERILLREPTREEIMPEGGAPAGGPAQESGRGQRREIAGGGRGAPSRVGL